MSDAQADFQSGVVRPVECFRSGWQLIREKYWLMLGISIVGVLIAQFVPFSIAVGPAMCGIYLCLFRLERGQSVKFEHLMRGIDYFLQSFIATLFMVIPILLIVVPAYLVFLGAVIFETAGKQKPGAPPDPDMGITILVGALLFTLVIFVVSIVISVLFIFVYPLIVERKLTGVQAVKTSIRAAFANLGGVLGFTLLNIVLHMVGSLACCVGGYFLIPVHMAAVVVAYRAVFPALPAPEQPVVEQDPNDPNRSDFDELN
ncbi:MAG TPA: hypothetical protein VHR66_16810 [Gemmataceae bacterium]|jgi:uncharacterized membrane protein|nr:hypothetical protein [Gemmataceae bacterium]